MAISNGYCTLAQVKAALRITDPVDDALIELSIEAASREIDGICDRVFYSTTATRVFIPDSLLTCQIDDLVSVTTFKTASDGVTFDTTWATTDYQLEPLNGTAGGSTVPANFVRAVGDYFFPYFSQNYGPNATVQINGVWGWSAIPSAIKQATILLSMRQFKRYDAPLGIAGFGDIGGIRVGRVDPDVDALIAPFKRLAIA
jgi:hypothetical protein